VVRITAVAEHDGNSGAVTAEYVYVGGRIIAKELTGVGRRYYLSDRLSERLVLDASGNVLGQQGHNAFGGTIGASGEQEKHHFTSYEQDAESGLHYAVNRYYSPLAVKFMSADPYKCQRRLKTKPQSGNLYSYVLNDAVNRLDPLGLDPVDPSSDANKIPVEHENEYRCNNIFDSCKSMGEKIRDLTASVGIRLAELDPSTPSYRGHAKVWANQKNILSDCVAKFQDKGCGPPDLPSGFDLQWAIDMAQAPSPNSSSFMDFVNRGGLEFLTILTGTTIYIVAPGELALIEYFLGRYGCLACEGFHVDALGDLGS